MNVDEYKIKCYTKFSWGYVYSIGDKRYEIWADNLDSLKRKALDKDLPWDEKKVPKAKPVKIRSNCITLGEGSPAQFRLPWCKSNYKRY